MGRFGGQDYPTPPGGGEPRRPRKNESKGSRRRSRDRQTLVAGGWGQAWVWITKEYLREPDTAYNSLFDGKKGALSPEKPILLR